jgi:hypothetical protein
MIIVIIRWIYVPHRGEGEVGMLRSIVAALAVAVLGAAFCVIPATAAEPGDSANAQAAPGKTLTREDLLKSRNLVQSEHQQRAFRAAYWAAGLTGDKKAVYETYGYPSGRSRAEKMGTVTETWTYVQAGRSFTFRGNTLIED